MTRAKVEQQFHAKSFDNFAELEESRNRIDMAKLFKHNGNQDKTFYKDKKGQRENAKEKHLIFELISATHYAVTFKNFFDTTIKDLIKNMTSARYDAETKAWTIPVTSKDELITKVGPKCLSDGITLVDVPKFVVDMLKTNIPFGKSTKAKK